MNKRRIFMKKLYVVLGILIIFICLLGTNVNAETTVSNWNDLKTTINNSTESKIEINLSQGTWNANSPIEIKARKRSNNKCQ